jgi:hypothetical protein
VNGHTASDCPNTGDARPYPIGQPPTPLTPTNGRHFRYSPHAAFGAPALGVAELALVAVKALQARATLRGDTPGVSVLHGPTNAGAPPPVQIQTEMALTDRTGPLISLRTKREAYPVEAADAVAMAVIGAEGVLEEEHRARVVRHDQVLQPVPCGQPGRHSQLLRE